MNGNPLLPCLLAAALSLTAAPGLAPAQAYPTRPVRIVVPASPGDAVDLLSRALAPRLSQMWRMPVLVENRGANPVAGVGHVAKAAPDGATLLISDSSTFVLNPHLYKKLPYDALKSFTPITVLARVPWVVAVHADVPAASFQQLVALAKAKPGALSYGSLGPGSSTHVSMEYLKQQLEMDMVHVPFKGESPAITALLTGQIQIMMITPFLVESHARGGRLKILAAATARRIPAMNQLPTVAESGVPGYEAGTWFALVGPARLPREVVRRIYADTTDILLDPAFLERYLTSQWFEVVGNTPEEFTQFLKSEYERWDRVVELSGVTVE
jgi:tripartite-type tricarboxylate transporter receptor subunit TctC